MSTACEIDPADICWTPPESFVCDPCIDLANPADKTLFDEAFKLASSFVYRKTGSQWPGKCWIERVRPCFPKRCWCPRPCDCRNPTIIDLTGVFCLPLCDIVRVNVGEQPCFPDGATWTRESGEFRVERHNRNWQVVRQADEDCGCCPRWPEQDMCAPDGGACSWSIDARTGCDPPPDVLMGTAAMAIEIIKECQRTGCTIIRGARTVTTRNVTVTRDDDIGTGLWWDVLKEVFEAEKDRVVEQFGMLHSTTGTHPYFVTVFGPVPDTDPIVTPPLVGV